MTAEEFEDTEQKAQTLLNSINAIATALYDTIEDETLPRHLRKVQLKNLLEHIEELRRVVG